MTGKLPYNVRMIHALMGSQRTPSSVNEEPSSYIQTLTRYLENIMSSTLLGLPREIKELIYFDALSHAADKILVSRWQCLYISVELTPPRRCPYPTT